MNVAKIKEVTFNKVCDWLRNFGSFEVEVIKSNNRSENSFEASVKTYINKDKSAFVSFKVEFNENDTDSFMIHTAFTLDEEMAKSVDSLRRKEQQQIYIDLRKMIYPLDIQFQLNFPQIILLRVIFIDDLKKQFFFDSISHLLNARQLIEMRFDEEYYKMFPDGGKSINR